MQEPGPNEAIHNFETNSNKGIGCNLSICAIIKQIAAVVVVRDSSAYVHRTRAIVYTVFVYGCIQGPNVTNNRTLFPSGHLEA